MTTEATFALTDSTGKTLPVRVEQISNFLNIHPLGYHQPVTLDYHEGKLSVLVNPDKDNEEPQIISLEGAKEDEDGDDDN